MSKNKSVVIVYYDDWEGLYIDGTLCYEGHRIDADCVLEHLNIKHSSVECPESYVAKLNKKGCFPPTLKELKIDESE